MPRTSAVRSVPVDLDRRRHLRYDLNALVALEDETGKKLKDLDFANLAVKDVRAVLWAGLVHEDEALTLRATGALIGMANLGDIMGAVSEAISGALPDPKPDQPAGDDTPLVGSTSGQSPATT